MTELVIAGVAIFLAIVFFYQARYDRRQGDEARALLGKSYEERDELVERLARAGLPLPTASEFRDRLHRMRPHASSSRSPAS